MSDARTELLAVLRNGRPTEAPPLPPVLRGTDVPVAERVARFMAVLNRIGGRGEIVADLTAAAARVRELLAEHGARSLATSDAPEVAAIAAALPPDVARHAPDADRATLLACDAGLTAAQFGIAETGTLVLVSAAERHRLASLLPPLHIALLPVERLCGSLGDACARLQASDGAPAARTITFVTGPSRTADIELTLVVGVHGPKALWVLLVGGDGA